MLEVPVGGDLKHPQFDVGQTIKSALTKTVDDVAKSPFSTVKEIDGIKGEVLRYIEFEPGLWELDTQATKKLNALARFMNARKELTVGVAGTADRRKDGITISEKQPEKEMSDKKSSNEKAQKNDKPFENVIDDKQLEQLAQMRAQNVQTYLTQQGSVAAKRVQLKPIRIIDSSNKDNWGVEFFLSTH